MITDLRQSIHPATRPTNSSPALSLSISLSVQSKFCVKGIEAFGTLSSAIETNSGLWIPTLRQLYYKPVLAATELLTQQNVKLLEDWHQVEVAKVETAAHESFGMSAKLERAQNGIDLSWLECHCQESKTVCDDWSWIWSDGCLADLLRLTQCYQHLLLQTASSL